MSLPSWAPTTAVVASRTPNRAVAQTGSPTAPELDFTAQTTPTLNQVAVLLDEGCTWLLGRTGVLDPTLESRATNIVANRVAGLIQLAYPIADATYDYAGAPGGNAPGGGAADRWLALADKDIADLVAANERLTQTPPPNGPGEVSYWSYPDPLNIWERQSW
jgi:hypothetical protein